MSPVMVILLVFLGFLFLAVLGMPIAFAFATVGAVTLFFWAGGLLALDATALVSWSTNNSFTFTAIPLFVFAGEILLYAGFSRDLFEMASRWTSRVPGSLGVAAIVACAIFSASCGSSVATAATIGEIAIPELKKRNYDRKLIYGSLAAGGTLGILIPPSICMIIFAGFTGASVGKLFLAGFIPGFSLAALFALYIVVRAIINPEVAPRAEGGSWRERFVSVTRIWPILVFIIVIFGSIYGGVATPTEAAGVGAFIAVVMSVLMRRLKRRDLLATLHSTMVTTCMVMFCVTGALILGNFLTDRRIPAQMVSSIMSLQVSRYVVLAAIVGIYLILGCFMEATSMMVMTLPIVAPAMVALGFDLVWFGIIMVILVELALITPPVAVNLYVIHKISGEASMKEIMVGIVPFAIIMLGMIGLLTAFPQIALWLPSIWNP